MELWPLLFAEGLEHKLRMLVKKKYKQKQKQTNETEGDATIYLPLPICKIEKIYV